MNQAEFEKQLASRMAEASTAFLQACAGVAEWTGKSMAQSYDALMPLFSTTTREGATILDTPTGLASMVKDVAASGWKQ